MGTETYNYSPFHAFTIVWYVEKNNPLMGTETMKHVINLYELWEQGVEKNNPLMGTETVSICLF